jgi:hypothetical protein
MLMAVMLVISSPLLLNISYSLLLHTRVYARALREKFGVAN